MADEKPPRLLGQYQRRRNENVILQVRRCIGVRQSRCVRYTRLSFPYHREPLKGPSGRNRLCVLTFVEIPGRSLPAGHPPSVAETPLLWRLWLVKLVKDIRQTGEHSSGIIAPCASNRRWMKGEKKKEKNMSRRHLNDTACNTIKILSMPLYVRLRLQLLCRY